MKLKLQDLTYSLGESLIKFIQNILWGFVFDNP